MLDEAGIEDGPQVLAELIEQVVKDGLARSAFLKLVCRSEVTPHPTRLARKERAVHSRWMDEAILMPRQPVISLTPLLSAHTLQSE